MLKIVRIKAISLSRGNALRPIPVEPRSSALTTVRVTWDAQGHIRGAGHGGTSAGGPDGWAECGRLVLWGRQGAEPHPALVRPAAPTSLLRTQVWDQH